MPFSKVPGKKTEHKVVVYALSTCVWCKMTKQFLKDNEIEFEHIDVDRDIICPCDSRDPDVAQYGACYCRLYVNNEVYEKKVELPTVPERRPMEKQSRTFMAARISETPAAGTQEKPTPPSEIKPKLW